MRLFVGVRPPDPVLDEIAALVVGLRRSLGSGSEDALRWASRDQWHVTLRFLGEVDDPEPVVAALAHANLEATQATLGPVAKLLGRQVVSVPVGGLDALAAGVSTATAGFGRPPDDRSFHGHVTLARLRGRGRARGRGHGRGRPPWQLSNRDLAGPAIEAHWGVDAVALVRSHLSPDGARYEDLYVRSLP